MEYGLNASSPFFSPSFWTLTLSSGKDGKIEKFYAEKSLKLKNGREKRGEADRRPPMKARLVPLAKSGESAEEVQCSSTNAALSFELELHTFNISNGQFLLKIRDTHRHSSNAKHLSLPSTNNKRQTLVLALYQQYSSAGNHPSLATPFRYKFGGIRSCRFGMMSKCQIR